MVYSKFFIKIFGTLQLLIYLCTHNRFINYCLPARHPSSTGIKSIKNTNKP